MKIFYGLLVASACLASCYKFTAVDSATTDAGDSGPKTPDKGDGSTESGGPIQQTTADNLGLQVSYIDSLTWNADSLYFTEPYDTKPVIVKYTPASNSTMEYVYPTTGAPLGITNDGKTSDLIFAASPTDSKGAIWRVPAGLDTEQTKAASQINVGTASWYSPNEVVVRPTDGMIYVTDPGYQLSSDANGVYRVDPTGAVSTVATFSGDQPNGIALSPDSGTLYVSLTERDKAKTPSIVKFTVNADGSTSDSVKFVDMPNDSLPDGLAVDTEGNVFAATQTGVQVFAQDGHPWGTITVPAPATLVTNVAFGDADLKTLYIATDDGLFKARVNFAGLSYMSQ
ncbi:MAG: SMP-30/gluconolactonase/LRE family protein [Polyangiaceae bacterium]|nr:SMP-30/gluconolactonase/LRE family protein [Polyangiaceae bacterium]